MINIVRTNNNSLDFIHLIKMLDEDLKERYGKIQQIFDAYNKTESIKSVLVAYEKNEPVGIGCFKELDLETIEIKRMFVRKESRGKGIAKLILLEIEKWAIESGYRIARLETGIYQPEAISLYAKNGFIRTENYGQYAGIPESVCFSKILK